MKIRINILAIFMIIAVIFCEINLAATSDNYILEVGSLSDTKASDDHYLSFDANTAFIEFCTPELISGHLSDTLFGGRLQTKDAKSRNPILRILVLWVATLYIIELAFRRYKFGRLSQKSAGASSAILYFIHNKDGKK